MPHQALYIGRVGALAVALGVGIAVANSPCIASADPGISSSATASESSSSDSHTSSDDAASGATTAKSANATDPAGASSTTGNEEYEKPQTHVGASDLGDNEDDEKDQAEEEADLENQTPEESAPQESEEASDDDNAPPRRRSSSPTPRRTLKTTTVPDQKVTATVTAASVNSTPVDTHTGGSPAVALRSAPQAAVVQMADVASSSENQPAATAMRTSLTSSPAPQPTTVAGIVSSVLAWVGLGADASNSPTTPAESPGLLALLAWARREIQQMLSGKSSTTARAQVENSQTLALAEAAAVAAAPAFVQVNSAVPQTDQSTVPVTYTAAQTAGNTNILAIGWNNATSNITSVTDSAGNVYQLAVPTARGAGLSQAIYYAKNIKAAPPGTNTVSVTFNAPTQYVDIRATEYSGLDPNNPFDVGTSASGTSATASTGNVTTTAPGLVFGAGMTTGGFTAGGTGFTTRVITNPDADILADRIVTSSGAYNATASLGGSSAWVMQVATFKAATIGGDTVAPTVTITDPPGGVVSGTFQITANASDNAGVAGVQFLVDNNPIGAEDTTSPYGTFLNTIPLSNGTHTLTAVARDINGNTATSTPVTITVNNVDTSAPAVTLTAPTGTVSGTVTLTATATDNAGVAGVRFLVDGNAIGTQDTTAPYSQTWNTATVSNGTHTLTAIATDVNGLSTTSAPITVTVNNVASAPPAFKQVNSAVPQTNQLSVSVTYTAAQTAGDTNILAIGWNNATSNITSVTDSAGNVYEVAVPTARGAGLSQAIYYAKNIKAAAAGANTVTVTFNAPTQYVDIRATEYSGLDPNNPFDVGTSASGTSATANSGNVTTTAPGLIFGAGMTTGGYTGAGTGFTTRVITNPDADIVADRIVTSSGAYNATATLGGSSAWVMQVASFKAATTTGGDTVAPTVAITNPSGTVSGTITINANASDNVGVAGVRFLVDNNQIGAEDTTSPYGQTLNTTTLTNGTHTLTAIARDVNGNTATSASVTITVNNATTGQFENEVLVTGLDLPTAMKFLPDGRMLVAELGGKIKILQAPYTQADPTPFLQLTNVGNADDGIVAQQGIYDFVLDPNFATNHYYYVTYTARTPNRDRLSRFTANANLTGTVAGSEKILYEDPQNADTEHHGGAVVFGNDGKIYMTTGDHFVAENSQLLTNPRGKVLRFNPDGTIPTDNPFYDGAGPNYDAIWAYGLRNPYRAYFDPAINRLLIGDVGGNVASTAIEELNLGVRGANYGWANVEGNSTNPAYTNPIFSYPHLGRDAAITGGFVYDGNQFPSAYKGSYFYADYSQNWIKRLTFDANGNVTGTYNFEPANGAADGPTGDIVYLTQGPEGALYYIDLGVSDTTGHIGVSKIHRISFTGANQPPVAQATASPSSGPVPLTVNFSSAGSSDPEGQPLSYSWNFGDNTTSTLANPTHTYAAPGPYLVRVTVSDGVNSTISAPLTITVGSRPTATILAPTDASTFTAGQVITFSGSASDAEDGTLPPSAYTWQVDFLHEGHVHPGAPISGVTSGTLTVPTSGHDFSGNTRYRITLTVTDSSGLQSTTSTTIYPQKVNLNFSSTPAGATVYLDGIAHTGPFTYDTLSGFQHTISAPDQTINGTTYRFASWSDGGAQTHVITVPQGGQGLTANFTAVATAPPAFVQVNSAVPQTNQSSVLVTYTAAQTAGNTNILAIGWNNATSNITSVTDSAGNVYELAVPTARGAGLSQAIYYAKNIKASAAGTNTVTVSFNAPTQYVDIRGTEYSGLDKTNPFVIGTSAAGSGTSANSGNVTTTSPGLVFGAGMTAGGFTSGGTGFTTRVITNPDADIVADRLVTSAGTYNATASLMFSSAWLMQVATFKAASTTV